MEFQSPVRYAATNLHDRTRAKTVKCGFLPVDSAWGVILARHPSISRVRCNELNQVQGKLSVGEL